MAIITSGGSTTSTFEGVGSLATAEKWAADGIPLGLQDFFRSADYNRLYCSQPSVFTVVSKLAELQSTLPLKVYRRARKGREDAKTSPYGRLLTRPSTRMSTFDWRTAMASSFQVYGEAVCWKVRDDLGRPIELAPLHPTRLRYGKPMGGLVTSGRLTEDERRSGNRWWFRLDAGNEVQLYRRDLFIWKTWNPDTSHRGLSKLEPLRDALENDAAAQAAMEALWKQGGKPSFVLTHPADFGNAPGVSQRLADQWQRVHGGVANWHKPLILEEGMKPFTLSVDDSLQYLETRKLTDSQVAKVYKLNPAALGDLDRATFNNIVEILRDVYRSTMPPILSSFEESLDFEVRDGRHGDLDAQPDFGAAFYVEHELDGVLRGDFEKRMDAIAKGIQNGVLMPSEGREFENRPFVEGSDRLFINGAVVPLEEASRKVADVTPTPPEAKAISADRDVATLMGRLSRPQALADVDIDWLIEGFGEDAAVTVAVAYREVEDAGGSVADLRSKIKELEF